MKQGLTVWLTGLSESGKTTLANLVAAQLKERGLKVEQLDGDVVRQQLSKDLSFTPEDKNSNLERVTFVANLLTRNGVVVIVSLISPFRDGRAYARREIGHGNFIEVFVKCPLDECIRRDTKGLYKKALAGELKNFTGISEIYEEPTNPDVIVDTERFSPEECTDKIIHSITGDQFIKE